MCLKKIGFAPGASSVASRAIVTRNLLAAAHCKTHITFVPGRPPARYLCGGLGLTPKLGPFSFGADDWTLRSGGDFLAKPRWFFRHGPSRNCQLYSFVLFR
jgi:hypothetical protein